VVTANIRLLLPTCFSDYVLQVISFTVNFSTPLEICIHFNITVITRSMLRTV